MALNDRKCYGGRTRRYDLVSPLEAPGLPLAEDGKNGKRKEGRMEGKEGRISKDGRRLITPRDIRSFASVGRKRIAEREREGEGGERERERERRGFVCVNHAHVRTCAR